MATPERDMDAAARAPTPDELLVHADYLRALARRLAHDDGEAEDLVQETWIEALRHPAREIGKLRPWLVGVLRNMAREHRRGEGRRARRERASARDEALPAAGDVAARVEAFRDLAREVLTLDEPYRTTIVRLYFDGLGAEELAEQDGVPSGTVRSRHLRALRELRRRFDAKHGGRAGWIALFLPNARDARPAPPVARSLRAWSLSAAAIGVVACGWLALRLFASPPPSALVASAVEPPRVPSALAVDVPGGDRRREGLVAAGVPADASPLDLELVDERTGAPVPYFQLVASDDAGTSETLESDALGRVRGVTPFAHGTMALHLLDHPALAQWRERKLTTSRNLPWLIPWEHRARAEGPVRLALDVGPTFQVEIAGDAPPVDAPIVCRLFARATDTVLSETRAPLRRTHDGAWVRFSNEARALGGAAPWRLDARAGAHVARANVLDLSGRASAPTRLEFVRGATLVVETTGTREPGGRARPLDALVELFDVSDASAASGARFDERGWQPSGPGIHPFDGLAPGRWRVVARELGHARAETTIELAPGERTRVALALAPLEPAGDVAGTVEVAGRALPRVVVEIARVDAPELGRRLELGDLADAERRFEYAFRALPAGEYVVRARASGVHRWRPGSVRARPGEPVPALVADAPDASYDLVFRATDARTGKPVPHFVARLDVDPGAPDARPGERRASMKSSLLYGDVPSGAEIAWTIVAEGYVPARGDTRGFTTEFDHQLARVALEPGFGCELVLASASDGAPVRGARVLLDGRCLGATDRDGALWWSADAAPATIEVEHDAKRTVLDPRALASDGFARRYARLP